MGGYGETQVDRLALIKQMKPLGFSVQEMRELLDARDALARPDGGAADRGRRAAAAATIARYADAAAERIAKLRRQLAKAEGLAGRLRREAGG